MAKSKNQNEYSFTVRNPMLVRQSGIGGTIIHMTDPKHVYELCKDMLDMSQESVQLITLNSRNYVIDRHLITLGLMDQSLVHPREIYRKAISDSAAVIIMVHNHPSGDPNPSAQDIHMTKQLVEAGKIVEIKMIDHIIIARPTTPDGRPYISMRESGVVNFV